MCAVHPEMQGKVNVDAPVARSPRRSSNGTSGKPTAPHRRFGRRAFIGALGGGALAALLPLRGGSGGLLPLTAEPPPALAAAVPIARGCRFRRSSATTTSGSRSARLSSKSSPAARPGSGRSAAASPGRRSGAPAGERTRVTFHHELPENAGELSIHLHGGHNRTQFDGQPGGLTERQPVSYFCRIPRDLSARQAGNDLLLEPGGSKTYVYDLVEDGRPERASFQWYHDHRLDRTASHTWKGLAGMWIVDDEFEQALSLPPATATCR